MVLTPCPPDCSSRIRRRHLVSCAPFPRRQLTIKSAGLVAAFRGSGAIPRPAAPGAVSPLRACPRYEVTAPSKGSGGGHGLTLPHSGGKNFEDRSRQIVHGLQAINGLENSLHSLIVDKRFGLLAVFFGGLSMRLLCRLLLQSVKPLHPPSTQPRSQD